MNGNTFPMNLIDSIEKLLRYIIPGFLFVILVKISYPAETLTDFLKTISSTEFYALSPVFGFAIYNIHRVVFWSVDGMCRYYCGLNLMESLQGQALLKKISLNLRKFFIIGGRSFISG